MKHTKITLIALSILALGGLNSVVSASHSWGGYHWARTTNPFTLQVGDNLSSSWDPYLATTVSDWSPSSVLKLTIKPGKTNARTCKATTGRIEVCNSKYGNNGWLGIAQIWASGSHITKGVVKLNDTYFSTPEYNTPAWKNLVMCQEVGHAFGLDHQDELFNNPNLGTCMDYTSDPSTNQHPNQHDYAMLESLYSHLDTSTTVRSLAITGAARGSSLSEGAGRDTDENNPNEWGKEIRKDKVGHRSLHVRDLGNGEKVFTFVVSTQ